MTSPASAARVFVIVFAVSTIFPIVASVLTVDQVPQFVSAADVAIAALTVLAALRVETVAAKSVTDRDRATAYRVLRGVAVVILALMVVFFAEPDAIRWEILLIGLGWRAWLLVWVLPAAIVTIRGRDSIVATEAA